MFPNSCVGAILATYKGKPMKGTGFLLSSNLVLTVAHNVCSREGVEINDILFYPGVSGDHTLKDSYRVIDKRLPPEYKKEGKKLIDCDYALLKLDRHVEGKEFIELGVNYIKQKEKIGIIGYRGPSVSLNYAKQSSIWEFKNH